MSTVTFQQLVYGYFSTGLCLSRFLIQGLESSEQHQQHSPHSIRALKEIYLRINSSFQCCISSLSSMGLYYKVRLLPYTYIKISLKWTKERNVKNQNYKLLEKYTEVIYNFVVQEAFKARCNYRIHKEKEKIKYHKQPEGKSNKYYPTVTKS